MIQKSRKYVSAQHYLEDYALDSQNSMISFTSRGRLSPWVIGMAPYFNWVKCKELNPFSSFLKMMKSFCF